MGKFRDEMHQVQLSWRHQTLADVRGEGWWQGTQYPHILPRHARERNLWPGIAAGGQFPLAHYLTQHGIQAHTGRDNLLSSWTLAANLYFPFGRTPEGLAIVASFLNAEVDSRIDGVSAVELEWEHPDPALRPPRLLGETDGGRGTNQTSPDVAFEVTLKGGGRGVVLTEVKFTEHNFYPCSIRKQLGDAEKAATCHDLTALSHNPGGQHTVKHRRYWDHLAGVFAWGAPLRWCPAATAGYQLFRQQALAEALTTAPDLRLVVSSLAYDERNHGLVRSLRRTGVTDVSSGWDSLFSGKAPFRTFTHQAFVAHVRQTAQSPGWCTEWLSYVSDRYGY